MALTLRNTKGSPLTYTEVDNNFTYINNKVISVTDYDAVGDGVTDDLAASIAALAISAGKRLRFPAGTYRLPFTTTTALTPPAGCVLEGDGKDQTTLVFVPSSTTDRNCFLNSAGNLTIRGMRITVEAPTNGSVSLVALSANGTLIEDCELDGAVTNSGSTISHDAYAIKFPASGTVTDVDVINCDIRRIRYGTLKSNASTAAVSRLSFTHCDFYGNYNEDLSFNSPLGSMTDVQVYMCRFRDGSGTNASLNQLLCAFASVTNFRVGGCSFSGATGDAIHIEENCIGGSVTGCNFEVNPGTDGAAIWVSDNDVGGSDLMPQGITITGNTIRKLGTQKEASKYGLWLVNNASAEVAGKNFVITGNFVEGFVAGYIVRGVSLDDGCLVSGNVAYNCTNGYAVEYGSLNVTGNTSRVCDVGVQLTNGGAIKDHTFIECTTNVDAVTIPAGIVNPSWMFTEFSNTGGNTTNKALMTIGANDRVHGFLQIHASCELSSAYSVRRDEVTWDGTTFTRTNKIDVSPGGMDSDSVDNSGVLSAAVFTSVTRNTIRLNVNLDGYWAVAV